MPGMKRRNVLLIGLGVGYVLGAKAGRERYEQIRRAARVVANNPPIRRLIDDVRELSDTSTVATRSALSEQLHSAGGTLRRLAG
jgi:hypothetical protein